MRSLDSPHRLAGRAPRALVIGFGLAVFAWGTSRLAPKPAALRAGGPAPFCDFERVEPWDISPETGFTLSPSTEHVTQGTHSLKVQFPAGEWPSINTKRLRQPVKEFEALTLDVFNPQPRAMAFAIRLDDRARRRVTLDVPLASGANHVRIPRTRLGGLKTDQLFFIALFLKGPAESTTLYFDNLALEPASAQAAPAPTTPGHPPQNVGGRPAQSYQPRTVPPAAPPVTSGSMEVPVVALREAGRAESLVSTGIPFAPGQLQSERDLAVLTQGRELPLAASVLARWPQDGSIRSALVQFRLNAEAAGAVTLRWGVPRTAPDLAATPVTWDVPEAMLLLPPTWLCGSRVAGPQVPLYDHEFPAYDDRIRQYYPARRDDALTGNIGTDTYYSTPHVFYQLYVRTGDVDMFLAARKEALHYRDEEILHEGPDRGRHRADPKTRYVYVEAMADDYLLTGDPRSLEVAKEMAEYLRRVFDPAKAFYPKDATNFWTEREVAFPFLGMLAYYELSGDREYLEASGRIMQGLYRLQSQWPGRGGFIHNLYAHDTEEGARPDEYGGSPFMTGLLLEPVIKYHQLTGSAEAAQSVFLALDWLMNEALTEGDTFVYTTADAQRGEGGHPDLNLLIVHAFGYGYRLSGYTRTDYRDVGIRLFERGIRDASLKDRKHFNQNYRSSGQFLAYLADAPRPGDVPEPPTEPGTPPTGVVGDGSAEGRSPRPADVLYAADFEVTLDGWGAASQQTAVQRDGGTAYAGRAALQVRGSGTAAAAVRKPFPDWPLDLYPSMRLAYRIPRGTSVVLRGKTPFGDWIAIGATAQLPPTEPGTPPTGGVGDGSAEGRSPRPEDGEERPEAVLADDGQWHELTIDVAGAIHHILPGVSSLTELEVSSPAGAVSGFWMDAIRVGR